MQIARPNVVAPARRAAAGIAAAPLMASLALTSIVITVVVAIATVSHGRLPATGSIGLVCALVLAAVAVGEASRPARSERLRRRTPPPPASPQDVSDVDAYRASRWR